MGYKIEKLNFYFILPARLEILVMLHVFYLLISLFKISVASVPTASIPLWSSFSGEKSITDCTLDSWEVWKASLPH